MKESAAEGTNRNDLTTDCSITTFGGGISQGTASMSSAIHTLSCSGTKKKPGSSEIITGYCGERNNGTSSNDPTGKYKHKCFFIDDFYTILPHFYNLTSDFENQISTSTSKCSNLQFSEQSLVTFLEDESTSTNKAMPHPSDIKAIVSTERNFNGQLYMVQDLNTSGHCTVETSTIHDEIFGIDLNDADNVPYLHVPKCTNYTSPDNKIVVINHDNKRFGNGVVWPIEKTITLFTKMFEYWLAEIFEYDNKKGHFLRETKKW